MRKLLVLLISLIFIPQALAFEDCVITNDSKLSEIKIEYNDIIDVYPLYTIMNDKNTLIVHPLKEGTTRFSVKKNNKNTVIFLVKVEADKTIIDNVDGFDIFTIDYPPEFYEFELDEPPVWIN